MDKPQLRIKELSKFGASYYAGLTIEADPDQSTLKLAIDGQRIQIKTVGRSFVSPEIPRTRTPT